MGVTLVKEKRVLMELKEYLEKCHVVSVDELSDEQVWEFAKGFYEFGKAIKLRYDNTPYNETGKEFIMNKLREAISKGLDFALPFNIEPTNGQSTYSCLIGDEVYGLDEYFD